MDNQYICHYGTKGMKWGVRNRVREAESNYRSDVKSIKKSYKQGKKTYKTRDDKLANKLSYKRSLGRSADRFNKEIEKIGIQEGGRLTEKSKNSTTRAKAKANAKVIGGVLVSVGGMTIASLSGNKAANLGGQVVSAVLGGALVGKGINEYAAVKAYEGDTSLLRRKTARGLNI